MESGAEQASLYTVLQEKKIGVGAAMMGSAHTYEVPLVNTSHQLPSSSISPLLFIVAWKAAKPLPGSEAAVDEATKPLP